MKKLFLLLVVVGLCIDLSWFMPSTVGAEKPIETPTINNIEYYGVTIPNTPLHKSYAQELHLKCSTGDIWYSPESSEECKLRRYSEIILR